MGNERLTREAEGLTLHVDYDYSPANTLRWARALAIIARIRRRVSAQQKGDGGVE